MTTHDPDSFICEHGAEAMQAVIDGAVPLRALMVTQALIGFVPDPKVRDRAHARWTLTDQDLIDLAAELLSLAGQVRAMMRAEASDRSADRERAVIALATRGQIAAGRIAAVPVEVFTSRARLFVWHCAGRCVRALGPRLARAGVDGLGLYVGERVGRPFDVLRWARIDGLRALDLSADETRELADDADEEIDRAERCEACAEDLSVLVQTWRAREALAWTLPVLSAIDRGEPTPDTAARLREAADLFEGRGRDHG